LYLVCNRCATLLSFVWRVFLINRGGDNILKRWVSKKCSADFLKIATRYNITEIFAEVLVKRGLYSWEAMDKYLFPDINMMYAPELMKDLAKTCNMLEEIISKGIKTRVIGDYDVDGIMSSYILVKGLSMLGGNVDYKIPHRVKDGYGIRSYMVDEAYNCGAGAIITCDNGISAPDAALRAKELGMKYILTDHHEVPAENGVCIIPEADAVVNPKQPDCNYPFGQLCGAGVAYKIMSYIFEKNNDKSYIGELLPFAAIATVCDVVPLTDENRIIVSNGLKILSDRSIMRNKGMVSLLNELKLSDKINPGALGFRIGPCINAAGRLSDASKGMELLLEEDEEKAKKLAQELVALNDERKDLTAKAEAEADKQVMGMDIDKEPVLVIYLENCHESVAGIVAGRVREKYYRPSYILTKGEKELKGSGRSIPGYHMQQELMKCQDILTEFGGHAMAAGFSLPEENLEKLRSTLNKQCPLKAEEMVEKIVFDKEVGLGDVSMELVEQLKWLEPFGEENSRAVFAKRGVIIKSVYMCGAKKQVARIKLEDNGQLFDAVDFNAEKCTRNAVCQRYGEDAWEDMKNGSCGQDIDILYVPYVNGAYGNIQFRILDCR